MALFKLVGIYFLILFILFETLVLLCYVLGISSEYWMGCFLSEHLVWNVLKFNLILYCCSSGAKKGCGKVVFLLNIWILQTWVMFCCR